MRHVKNFILGLATGLALFVWVLITLRVIEYILN